MPRDIEESVRNILLFHHALTAAAVRLHLARQGRRVSLVSVYKALNRLIKKRMLLKSGETYVVNLSWILETRQSLNDIYESVLHGSSFSNAIGLDTISSRRLKWRFSSLADANNFWIQLLITIAERSRSAHIIESVPFLWYPYLPHNQDESIQRAFKQLKAKITVYVREDNALNRSALHASRTTRSYRALIAPTKMKAHVDSYFALVGDYIFQLHPAQLLSRQLQALGQKSLSTPAAQQSLVRILQSKFGCSLTLEFNPRRAEALRRLVGICSADSGL
jgi:predicted transcriptional regulator